MIPNLDIYHSTNVLMKSSTGRMRRSVPPCGADAMLEKGDLDGHDAWKRTLTVVEELQRAEPGPDGKVH